VGRVADLGAFGNVKTKVVIGVLAGLLLAVIALWVSFSAASEHDPRDLLYWGQAGGTNDWSAAAVQGNARAQFFCGFALIRTNLQTMIGRIPRLSAIPIIGKRFFQTISYSIDNRISQEQLAEAYRWIKQSADQGFPPAREAEKLFMGKIKVPNESGAAIGSQPFSSETNRASRAAGSRR
jgi:hypothetical protein